MKGIGTRYGVAVVNGGAVATMPATIRAALGIPDDLLEANLADHALDIEQQARAWAAEIEAGNVVGRDGRLANAPPLVRGDAHDWMCGSIA